VMLFETLLAGIQRFASGYAPHGGDLDDHSTGSEWFCGKNPVDICPETAQGLALHCNDANERNNSCSPVNEKKTLGLE
jgi:hypothetical protein